MWAGVEGVEWERVGSWGQTWNSLCVPWQQASLFHCVHAPKVPDALTDTQFLNG